MRQRGSFHESGMSIKLNAAMNPAVAKTVCSSVSANDTPLWSGSPLLSPMSPQASSPTCSSPGIGVASAESKGKVLRPNSPNTSALSLRRELSQGAPNLRQTLGHRASGATNMSVEPPGTVKHGRVLSSGQTNGVTEMSDRHSSMAETSDPSNPSSLVDTDPKVIRATVANGLIATRENQDEQYGLSAALSSSLGATSEPCQAQSSEGDVSASEH